MNSVVGWRAVVQNRRLNSQEKVQSEETKAKKKEKVNLSTIVKNMILEHFVKKKIEIHKKTKKHHKYILRGL